MTVNRQCPGDSDNLRWPFNIVIGKCLGDADGTK